MNGAVGNGDMARCYSTFTLRFSRVGCRATRDIDGQTERSNGAFRKSDIEGKAAMGSERELGSERVSNAREHISQFLLSRVNFGSSALVG